MSAVPLQTPDAKIGFVARGAATRPPAGDHLVDRAVARAKQGDRDALEFLYVRYADHIYGYLRSIIRDAHEAEDVTQQVFAKLMVVLDRYDRSGAPFFAWLLRLAHNAAIDQLRSRRAIPAPEIFGSDERSDETRHESGRSLHEALATLPEDQRTVVVLRHVLGLTPQEIAGRIQRSESAVHGLHHRGRRALQIELLRHQAGPCTAPAAGHAAA